VRKKEHEVSGIGAAIAAGLKVGMWENLDEVQKMLKIDREFNTTVGEEEREKKMKRWRQAIERSIGFGWDN
jgi:glycerol kinase